MVQRETGRQRGTTSCRLQLPARFNPFITPLEGLAGGERKTDRRRPKDAGQRSAELHRLRLPLRKGRRDKDTAADVPDVLPGHLHQGDGHGGGVDGHVPVQVHDDADVEHVDADWKTQSGA